jgi:hypothetical protein
MHLITFHSAMFDVASEPENPINPIPGHALLVWLSERLGDGWTANEPAAEDWGWYVDVVHAAGGATYLLGASGDPDDGAGAGGAASYEWKLQIDRHRTMVDKFKGANKHMPDDPLTARVAAVLRAEPAIRDIEVETPA